LIFFSIRPDSYSSKEPDNLCRVGGLYKGCNTFKSSRKKGFSTTSKGIPQQTKALSNALSIVSITPISNSFFVFVK
jgi:hypothetical protein